MRRYLQSLTIIKKQNNVSIVQKVFIFFRDSETVCAHNLIFLHDRYSALRIPVRLFLGEKNQKNCGSMYIAS